MFVMHWQIKVLWQGGEGTLKFNYELQEAAWGEMVPTPPNFSGSIMLWAFASEAAVEAAERTGKDLLDELAGTKPLSEDTDVFIVSAAANLVGQNNNKHLSNEELVAVLHRLGLKAAATNHIEEGRQFSQLARVLMELKKASEPEPDGWASDM